jgi:hypothetical protein
VNRLEIAARRIEWSVRRRGIGGTLFHVLRRPFRPPTPGWQRDATETAADEDFDRRFNVDTTGIIKLQSLKTASSSWVYGVDYEPTREAVFMEMVSQLEIPYAEYTFVDFGAGKGKALLLAAGLPFKRIVGVELAQELCDVARENLRTYSGPRVSGPIDIQCGDAVDFDLPSGPLVLHLYNPFEANVLAKVIDNVRRSLLREPRPVWVLYVYPRWSSLLEADFRVAAQVNSHTIFRSQVG